MAGVAGGVCLCLVLLSGLRWTLLRRTDSLDAEKFNKNFTVGQNIIDELLTFAESQGLEPDLEGFNTSKDEILMQLKALIALNQFSTNYYFQIVNQNNKALQKAVNVLNSWESYKHLVKD